MKVLLNMLVILLCGGEWAALANAVEDANEKGNKKLEFKFESPVELLADGKAIKGTGYPSPTLYDIDRDGNLDLVVGDIMGNILVSQKSSASSLTKWDETKNLECNGEPIRLKNW